MRILHVLRAANDRRARQVATAQSDRHQVALLLLQDATGCHEPFVGPVFACRDDVPPTGGPPAARLLDYPGIVSLLTEYERVVVW